MNIDELRQGIKKRLLEFVDAMDPSVAVSEPTEQRLKSLCDDLAEHTPVTAPMDNQQLAQGIWLNRFASFGAQQSRRQPMLHATTLTTLSFGNLPDAPMHTTRIVQEIEASTKAYNNVVYVANGAGDAHGVVVMYGRYSPTDDDPQRYGVEFYRVAFEPLGQATATELRQSFGIDPDAPLDREFGPARFYSDIVYLDDDTRINYGQLGGFYVLQRPGAARPFGADRVTAAGGPCGPTHEQPISDECRLGLG